MSILDQFEQDLEELESRLNEALDTVPGAIDRVCDSLRFTMPWAHAWVEDRRSEAHTHFRELESLSNTVIADMEVWYANIRALETIMKAKHKADYISFNRLLLALDQKILLGNRADWVSPNQELYEAKVAPLENRVRNMQTAVEELSTNCQETWDMFVDWVKDTYWTFCGLIVSLVGLTVSAITCIAPNPGSIIGLIASILGTIASIHAFFRLPDLKAEAKATAEDIRSAARTHDSLMWPEGPNLQAGAWA